MRVRRSVRFYCWLGLSLAGWLGGCSPPPHMRSQIENYGSDDDRVWVRGPWPVIKPSTDVDDVVDQMCAAVMPLPNAMARNYGQEYCGVLYTLDDGLFYASYPSPLHPPWQPEPADVKMCIVPRRVVDARGRVMSRIDYHSHPWAGSRLSQEDREARRQRYSIRIQFDSVCHVMKLIPYLEENRPGEVYERRGRSWTLIGLIKPEDKDRGVMTPVDDRQPSHALEEP